MQSIKSYNILKTHFVRELAIGTGIACVVSFAWYVA
jgi:hypothetical protein